MAEALISVLIEELGSMALQWVEEEVRLVKGAERDIGQLKSNLQAIRAVVEDAEKKQLTDLFVLDWLDKLKDASFEMDNVLDEWNTAFLKFKIQKEFQRVPVDQEKRLCCPVPSPFSCFTSKVNRFTLRHEIAHKIKDLNQRLDAIAAEKDRYNLNTTVAKQPVVRPETTSFIDETEIYGRDVEKEIVITKLLCENSTNQDQGLVIIPIVGIGGLGKTALAQLIYNDEKAKAHFDELIWVCVSDPFDVTKVAKAIIEEVEGQSPNINTLQSAVKGLHECIRGKRFLLVLDDVWTKDSEKWEQLQQPLKSGAVGSRILVTTRKVEVAIMMGVADRMISLEKLSDECSWLVFKRRAFLGRKEQDCRHLEEIGRKIASKSKGVPLVAKTLGSLMCFKNVSQWEDVLYSELWKLREVDEVFAPFLLSYNDLSPKEKRCFLYCSIFPKDYRISSNELIDLWSSQSYLRSEEEGQECFENLAMRSFFQNFETKSNDGRITRCKMHDIVRDFAHFLTRSEFVTMEVGNADAEEELQTLERARHLALLVGPNAKFPTLKYNKMDEQNIRSLFLKSYAIPVDESSFLHLKCLRTLNLAYCKLEELPESIGSLIHLRYLNLKGIWRLQKLPDTLCELCNLQTLKLRSCGSLQRLPEGIGKLVNLRHLNILSCDVLEGLPKGIGRLKGLQRLDMLVIPEAEQKDAFFDVGKFKMFENLRHRGSLHIKGCRNAGNEEVAAILDFKNSLQVSKLTLDFGKLESWSGFENDGALLELFEPHQTLLELVIYRYMGATTVSPRWLMSLTNLREVCFACCHNCEILPSLGKLPSLEILTLWNLARLEKVGVEFLGITEKRDEEDGNGAMNRTDSSIISFPKLKKLGFKGLPSWETWEARTVVAETSSVIMPCLTRLLFEECPRLRALPDFLAKTTSLKELVIFSSEIVEQWCQSRSGEEWAKISHVPNIQVRNSF